MAIVVALCQHDGDDDEEWDGIEAQDVQRGETYGGERRDGRLEGSRWRLQLDRRLANRGFALPLHRENHRVARRAAVDGIPQRIGHVQRLTVDGTDAIAHMQARTVGRPLGCDLRERHSCPAVRRLIARADRGRGQAVAVVIDEAGAVRRHCKEE